MVLSDRQAKELEEVQRRRDEERSAAEQQEIVRRMRAIRRQDEKDELLRQGDAKPEKRKKKEKPAASKEKPELDEHASTEKHEQGGDCLLYTSPSPRDRQKSRMPSSA